MPTDNATPQPTTDDLDGLYMAGAQQQVLDDEAAALKVAMAPDSKPVHGTYTRYVFHRVVTGYGEGGNVKNGVIDVFDEQGNFAHFVWDGTLAWGKGADEIGIWSFRSEDVTFSPPKTYMPNAKSINRTPNLWLVRPGDGAFQFPRNGLAKDSPFPCAVSEDAAPGRQYLYYDDGRLNWIRVLPDGTRVNLSLAKPRPVEVESTATTDQKNFTWGNDLFVPKLPQWDFPLLGWDVRRLDMSDVSRPPTTSGTTSAVSADAQMLDGTPIFQIPSPDSKISIPFTAGLDKTEYLALGTRASYQPGGSEQTATRTLSSLADRVNSWSLEVGVSAGIDKVFSAGATTGYKEKLDEQRRSESRYTVSEHVTTQYIVYTDLPNLQLHPAFQAAILAELRRLDAGDDPDWNTFIGTYGTHYVNALTYGTRLVAETDYSLQAECTAREQEFDLAVNAEATIEEFLKLGAKGKSTFNWASKFQTEQSTETKVQQVSGTESAPALIFLDLRPIWELMSPVFFQPNLTAFADELHAAAPFIWTGLRSSLQKYLEETVGINQPFDETFNDDLTPFIVEVHPRFGFWTNGRGARSIWAGFGWRADDGVLLRKWSKFHMAIGQAAGVHVGSDDATITGPQLVPTLDELRTLITPVTISDGSPLPGEQLLSATFAATPAVIAAGKGGILDVYLRDSDSGDEYKGSFAIHLEEATAFPPTVDRRSANLDVQVQGDFRFLSRPTNLAK